MTSATIICPNEECEADIDVEAEVNSFSQGHPYGSTVAYEHLVEVDDIAPAKCPECGEPLDENDDIIQKLIDAAEEW